MLPALSGEDPRAALRLIAQQLLASLDANADLVRVAFRDLRDHPELADRLFDGVLRAVRTALAGWLAEQDEGGYLREHDSDAVAAVLFSGLAYYPAMSICVGRAPSDVDRERLVETWIGLVTQGLLPDKE